MDQPLTAPFFLYRRSVAVAQGWKQSDADPTSHFVDEEKSAGLCVGYATGGKMVPEEIHEGYLNTYL